MSSTTADQLCRRFSLSEIHSATRDFSEGHIIGRGGFGNVYIGLIDNGSVTVAIKRLAVNSNQGEAEFESEMKTLTKFRHRNLLSLIGYCREQDEMILVYDYMPNGTLSDHLHKHKGSSFSWNQRLKICIGAGRGLGYLHSGCSIIHRVQLELALEQQERKGMTTHKVQIWPFWNRVVPSGRQGIKGTELERGLALSWSQRIKVAVGVARGLCYIHDKGLIHHNIKSTNVLLFDDETAKITDLHLSTEHPCTCKELPNLDVHPRVLHLMIHHYHPPECEWSTQTQKGDVYSFGVVLLELLTGSKLFDNTRRRGHGNLVLWAKPHLGSKMVHKIVDARLQGDYPPEAAEKMAKVAGLCLQYEAEFRPDMRFILQDLQPVLQKPSPTVENS